MSYNCAAWEDMITHLHNTGFQELEVCVLCLWNPLPTPVLLGWGSPMVPRLCHLLLTPTLPGPLLRRPLFTVSRILKSGLRSPPLVPAALSLNLPHPQSTTWTSREPERVRARSIPSVVNVACYHPCSLKVQPLPKKDRAEASHSSRSSMANCHMPETSKQQNGY